MSEDIQIAPAALVGQVSARRVTRHAALVGRVSARRVTRHAQAVQDVGLRCVNRIYGSCRMSGYASLTRPTGLAFDEFGAGASR